MMNRRTTPSAACNERMEALRQSYERGLASAHRAVAAAAPPKDTEASEYGVIVLPANMRRLRDLPRARRYRFVKLLMRALAEARAELSPEADPNADKPEPTEAQPELGAACAACSGRCCRLGGTRAFIDKAVMSSVIRRNPTWTDAKILAVYCHRLPPRTYERSCVFHGERGCGLSPELQSRTCRAYGCGGFNELRNRIVVDHESRFFLASVDGDRVIRSRFLDLSDR